MQAQNMVASEENSNLTGEKAQEQIAKQRYNSAANLVQGETTKHITKQEGKLQQQNLVQSHTKSVDEVEVYGEVPAFEMAQDGDIMLYPDIYSIDMAETAGHDIPAPFQGHGGAQVSSESFVQAEDYSKLTAQTVNGQAVTYDPILETVTIVPETELPHENLEELEGAARIHKEKGEGEILAPEGDGLPSQIDQLFADAKEQKEGGSSKSQKSLSQQETDQTGPKTPYDEPIIGD